MKLNTAQFAVIDTETTGLDVAGEDALVEIAAVPVNAPAGTGNFQTLVNPQRDIPPEVSAIHHLTNADLVDAPPADLAINWLKLKCAGMQLVAHNAAFDSTALGMTNQSWLCTQRLAQHLWPHAPSHSNQVLRYWLRLDVRPSAHLHAHRAEYDAICTAALLQRELAEIQRWHAHIDTVEALRGYVGCPVRQRTVRFGEHRGQPWNAMPREFFIAVLDSDQRNADEHHTAQHFLDQLQ